MKIVEKPTGSYSGIHQNIGEDKFKTEFNIVKVGNLTHLYWGFGEFYIWIEDCPEIKNNAEILEIINHFGKLEEYISVLCKQHFLDGVQNGKDEIRKQMCKALGI